MKERTSSAGFIGSYKMTLEILNVLLKMGFIVSCMAARTVLIQSLYSNVNMAASMVA